MKTNEFRTLRVPFGRHLILAVSTTSFLSVFLVAICASPNGLAAQEQERQSESGNSRQLSQQSDQQTSGEAAKPNAQASTEPLPLAEFRPKSMLKVEATPLTQARFPVIDIHSHFRHRLRHDPQALRDYIEVMNRNKIAVSVSLDGQLGDQLEEHKQYLWDQHKDRFAIFANLDFIGDGVQEKPATWACNRPEFARDMVNRLTLAKESGACGVKIFKQFGLAYRNADGSLIRIDDSRFDPIWKCCGDLGLPILIHTADPAAFFLPIDPTNERWEELSRHPDWSFYGPEFPSREELLEQRNRVIARHPETQFIAAHVANNAEDLTQVAQWLDAYPNLYVEFASRIGELGRQPYTARKFLIQYQDRVLFGTDGPWPETRLQLYWRFLETDDEYFPYSEKPFPPQGFWQIYGVFLPDEVLQKIYYRNALKLLPNLAEKYEQAITRWE